MYGLSTDGKDWNGNIRNLLSNECGGKTSSLGKSALFWTHENFDYEYGVGFRDKNTSNLDHGVLTVGENSETDE